MSAVPEASIDETAAAGERTPQRVPPPRLSARDFWDDLRREFLRGERGLPYTLWRMIFTPGRLLHDYVVWRDPRVLRPLRYFFVVVGVTAIIDMMTGATAGAVHGFLHGLRDAGSEQTAAEADLLALVERYRLALLLIAVPIIAFATGLTFHRLRSRFVERWVIGLYMVATHYLFIAVAELSPGRLHVPVLQFMIYAALLLHMVAAMRGAFALGWVEATARTLLALPIVMMAMGGIVMFIEHMLRAGIGAG